MRSETVRIGDNPLRWRNQATDWQSYDDAARALEELRYDHVWACLDESVAAMCRYQFPELRILPGLMQPPLASMDAA